MTILIVLIMAMIAVGGIVYTLSRRVDPNEIREKTDAMTPEQKQQFDQEYTQEYISWTNKPMLFAIPIVLAVSIGAFFVTRSGLQGNSFGISESYAYAWLAFGVLGSLGLFLKIAYAEIRSPSIFHAQQNDRTGWAAIMTFSMIGVFMYRHKYMKKHTSS